jgi:hypothetical protein
VPGSVMLSRRGTSLTLKVAVAQSANVIVIREET